MTLATITAAFWISLVAGSAVGLTAMILWIRKIAYPRVRRQMEASRVISLNATAMRTAVFGLPGILALIVCMVPTIYFNHLLEQHDYCRELVRFNDLQRDDPVLAERCGGLDRDELFAPADS